MTNKHKKKCSTSLIIRRIQVKTTMRYHFTFTRLVIIKKRDDDQCWWDVEKWEPSDIADGNGWQSLWKRVWQFLQRLNINLPYDSEILLLDIHPEEMQRLTGEYS